MIITHHLLGQCELEICVDPISSVDSFALSGYSITLDRELTDSELSIFDDAIQSYAWNSGRTLNHN